MKVRGFKAMEVGQWFVNHAHEHGDPISNLKLQKLLYYAQGWHLALYEKPLFDDLIRAWAHGPVVPSVYSAYKGWAWQPIPSNPAPPPKLSKHAESHLKDVFEAYGGMSAFDLERLTHSEPPWIVTRRNIPEGEPSNGVIPHALMKEYFSKLAKKKAR